LERGSCPEEEEANFTARLQECYEQKQRCAVIAVTFAAMALEAFFYDYAAEKFRDNFATDIDGLKNSLPTMFLIYPRIACGRSPDKSAEAFGRVKKLAAQRNALVHFKSKGYQISNISDAVDFHEEIDASLKDGVDNAIKCIPIVMAELDHLHGAGPNHVNTMKWTA
jgi:hypothetical protein